MTSMAQNVLATFGGIDRLIRQTGAYSIMGTPTRLDFYVPPHGNTYRVEHVIIVWNGATGLFSLEIHDSRNCLRTEENLELAWIAPVLMKLTGLNTRRVD